LDELYIFSSSRTIAVHLNCAQLVQLAHATVA